MKKRHRLGKYLRTVLWIVIMASLLCGCGLRLDRWLFLDGKDGRKEVLGAGKRDGQEENKSLGADSPQEDQETQDSDTSKLPWEKPDGHGQYENMDFDEFVEMLFQESVNTDTLTLHFYLKDPESYGITPGPVSLGTFSIADQEENRQSIWECRNYLAKNSGKELDREQQITRDLLHAYLDICERDMEFTYYYEPFKAGSGIHVSLPYSLAEYSFYSKQDVEDYLELLTQVDAYFQSIVTWEKEKAAQGLFMSDQSLDMVLAECEAYLWDGKDVFFLQESFEERLAETEGLTDGEKEEYSRRDNEILAGAFRTAYENLITELNKLRGRGVNDQGLFYYPRGQEYYEYLIDSSIGMTYSDVDELYQVLAEEIATLYFRMDEILSNADEELMNQWGSGYKEYRTPQEILAALESCITEDFPQLTQGSYRIKKVAKSMEEMMSPAFYMIPPIDSYDQNVIYLNEAKISQGGYDLFNTLAHEGYPGHLYQNIYFNSGEHCNFRKILQFTGYSEGWGTYVQYYSYRWMEGYTEEMNALSCMYDQVNMAFSAFLDVGIHYYGWTRENTAEVCKQLMGYEPGEQGIEDIYSYILNDPAGYLDYYVGYLEFRNMQEQAREALGAFYDAQQFHTFLLDFGPAPFTLIRPYFEEWLKEAGALRLECSGCSLIYLDFSERWKASV